MPIAVPAQLPSPGAFDKQERLTLDFKREPAKEPFEMAKDIAAFANAAGGTILIGAVEDTATGTLAMYQLMALNDVADAERRYEVAARDRCFPRPVVGFERVPQGAGAVLAVNVWPFIGQVIGVKVSAHKAKEGYGGSAYVFPVRVGTHATMLDPGQLAMFMIPSIRRSAILLSQIAVGEDVCLLPQYGKSHRRLYYQVVFQGADELQNRVAFTKDGTLVYIPLDAVESAWKDDAGWTIAAKGKLVNVGSNIMRWVFE